MNRYKVQTKEELIEYYEEVRKIKFKEDVEVNNIKDIIDLLLVKHKATVYTKGGHHCGKGRYRSLDDAIKIYKFYFPKKTIIDFAKEWKNSGIKMLMSYCPTIKKYNYKGFDYIGTDVMNLSFEKSNFPNCYVTLNNLIN